MKGKDHDRDRWLCSVRMSYEGMFSRFRKRVRYRGLVECRYQALMQALSHNMKRLLAIDAPPLAIRPDRA